MALAQQGGVARNSVMYALMGVFIGLLAPIGLVLYSRVAGEVPDLRIVFAVMAVGGTLTLGAAGWRIGRGEDTVKARNDELREISERFERLSVTDGLTGIANRRAFDERLEVELAMLDRHQGPLSLVMVDLDHFKRLNDRHGHPAGDEVLRRVAAILDGTGRAGDLVARYGGEEFAVILPHTDGEAAVIWAERARRAIASAVIGSPPAELKTTASFGVAEAAVGEESASVIIAKADEALYEAKKTGRDRVAMHVREPAPVASVC